MNGDTVYDLKRLRLLREVRFRGTLAAAAEALGYNPSTVSHQLAALEREVGVRLLEPIGRGVRLTDAALILVDHTEHALRHLEEAEAEIAGHTGRLRGVVRVATFQTAAHAVLPAVAASLLHDHPTLRLRVRHIAVEDALPALIARDFDLVLQEEFPGHPELRVPGVQTEFAAEDPMWLVSARTDPVDSLEDARDRPWAAEPEGTLARSWFTATCRSAGFEPRVLFESSDVLLHVRLAAAGAAVALVPGLALRSDAGVAGRVHALRPYGEPSRTISLAIRSGSGRSPAIRAVSGAFISAFQEMTGD
jgi:DNA-binding transcriptional LysR family regulator